MPRLLTAAIAAVLVLALGGCAPSNGEVLPTKSSTPSIDPALIPTTPPADAIEADPSLYLDQFGDYIFRAGDGPVWCSINTLSMFTLCEINEAAAVYKEIPTPQSCDYSYGYQVRLWETKPNDGEIADLVCAGGTYSDGTDAVVLPADSVLTVGNFKCFVRETTVRCDNATGNYIALGADAWALGN